jgi:GT2 family glycosyltransferase
MNSVFTALKNVMSVAVVIPTKNRPDDLDEVIAGVLGQTITPTQVIIVDQSGGDESEVRTKGRFAAAPAEVRDSIELCYIHDVAINGASAARNRALKKIRADIVLFFDDDVVLENNFVEETLCAYREYPDATGVSGIIVNYSPPSPLFHCWTRLFARGPFHDDRQPIYWHSNKLDRQPPLRVSRFGGGLMSFRMTAIAGTVFDENLSGACEGEDVDFCMHLPSPAVLLIAPKARLIHKQTPVARSSQHWLYLHARTNWYLYRRNWNFGIKNRLCLLWLNVGYCAVTAAVSLYRFSLAPWGSLFKAIADSRTLAGAR